MTLLWLSALVFVLVAALTAAVALKLWARPKAIVERVTGEAAELETRVPVHPSLAFRQMLARLGAMLPARPSPGRQIEKKLVRAGYRQPYAVRVLYGARVFGVAALVLAAAVASAGGRVPADSRPSLLAMAAMMGWMGPMWWVSLRASRRQRRIRRGLPDALDLLVICVESGLGLDQAMMQVAKELERAHPEISMEFAMVNLEMRTGKRRAEALRDLAERSAVAELKKLATVLIQADRFGTSVANSLRTHADYMRVEARQKAEEKAAKVGVKLVFPIFFCILPTLFVVTVGPMVVRIVREVLPMMNSL